MNAITLDVILKVLAGILLIAVICLARAIIKLYRREEKTEEEEKKLKTNEVMLTVLSVVFTFLAFFIPAATQIYNTSIQNNYGTVINGPVENLYGPVGGGVVVQTEEIDSYSEYEKVKKLEELEEELEGLEELEEVDSWPVGWSDSTAHGRKAYTLQEVNDGALDHQIVFNSISDGSFGHEFNFVGARENTGINAGSANTWNGNVIEAEKGKSYLVRIFAHNNSRLGLEDTAVNVSERFTISETKHVTGNDVDLKGFDSSNGYYAVAVHGYINVPDQEISRYRDGVKFVSNRPFHLEYIPGTARFENNGIGNAEHQGYRLSDEIMITDVLIGYDAMDGRIPACYQYSSFTCITVVPVFD